MKFILWRGGVVSMHKIEDNSLDLILTFPRVDSGDQIQIIRPGYKHFFLNPPSLLSGSNRIT